MNPAWRPVDDLCVAVIRALSIDVVENAKSGHPGLPMGAATAAYVLWSRHLRHDPSDPAWPDRDRFVLSAGHGSALLYSLLHLTGYPLTMDDLRSFRRFGSRTPGHPERNLSIGVEATTGPLGQGFANAVGMAIVERFLAARFNREGREVVDHFTYVLASDGDLMEGVSCEATSLAGDLGLGRLVVLYDSNRVTLSATTDVTFREDVGARFAACGWHVQHVSGDDPAALDAAFVAAKAEVDRPSLVVARTHIGLGSPHKQDTFHAHGEPLGAEEVRLAKRAYGLPEDRAFFVPDEAARELRAAVGRGAAWHGAWDKRRNAFRAGDAALAAEHDRALSGALPAGWRDALPSFPAATGDLATRDASAKVIEAVAPRVAALFGGSADLDPSTRTQMKGQGDFEDPRAAPSAGTQGLSGGEWGRGGRNVHFGIREHAMTAVLTGMALHGGVIPYGATFLTFSDYMRPAIRLAALSRVRVVYVFTHDSIALGEDGPTHQPIEHLASLRAMPGLCLLRPADAAETVEAWALALERADGPTALVLTRQKVPTLDRTRLASAEGTRRGAYVLADAADPRVLLLSTGSEVSLALAARERLAAEGVACRVVSMPSFDLFEAQPAEYRESVLPRAVRARVSVEAGSTFGWERYVGTEGEVVGLDRFGASGPGDEVMKRLGFTVERVVEAARRALAR